MEPKLTYLCIAQFTQFVELKDFRPATKAEYVRNLPGAFGVTGALPAGPVLLVDDLVDSGWTLAVLAVLLRQHGSGPVYPLALAKSSPGSG